MQRKRKQLALGLLLLCLGAFMLYFSLSFMFGAGLALSAVFAMTSKDGGIRQYMPLLCLALWMGVFLMLRGLAGSGGNVATLFFFCLAGSCFTLPPRRWKRYGIWPKAMGAGFALIGLLCVNGMWFPRLLSANLHIIAALGLIALAAAIFYKAAKSK